MKIVPVLIDCLVGGIIATAVVSETGSVLKALVAMILVGLYGILNFHQGITHKRKSQ